MCSAAHALVGLGRIVFASSGAQYAAWMAELGVAPGPVAGLSITQVAPGVPVAGPVPGLADEVRELVRDRFERARLGGPVRRPE